MTYPSSLFQGQDLAQAAQSTYGGYYNGMLNSEMQQQTFMQKMSCDAANSIQRLATKQKERTLFQEVKNDVTSFIKDHRGVIYFVALALLIDHFIFKGVFKARLQGMMESLIAKVETKVSEAK